MRTRLRVGAGLSALAILAAGCAWGASQATPSPSGPTPSPTATTPEPSPTRSCAQRTLARMTEEQRIGQLFMVGLRDDRLDAVEAQAIRDYHFGSVSFIKTTRAGAGLVREVARAVQALAGPETTGGASFFVAANQEGGLIQALQGPGFSTIPSAVDQGTMAPAALRSRATAWGRELLAAGVNLNLAPVLDVVAPGTDAENQPIGVLRRGYGHDPAAVASHGLAFLEGMAQAGVAAAAKHFPGLGRVLGNTDFTSNVVDRATTAQDPYLEAFRQAIDGGVPFVMVALATYTRIDPERQAVFSPIVMKDILRGRLGFAGVIVSDDIGAAVAIADIPPGERALDFLTAGGDMIISKTVSPAIAMARAVGSAAAGDGSLRARIDDAALRILKAKDGAGLLDCSD